MANKTEELVQKWIYARKGRERAEAEATIANVAERNAVNELGKWLCPEDAVPQEAFHVWIGSGILKAEKTDSEGNFRIRWRKEPDGPDRLKQGF